MKRNSIWNLLEVVLSSVILFVLYRLIIRDLGVSSLGVWSLVLATTSIARVADLGAAGGLGRYVALATAKGERGDVSLVYVETALAINAALYVLIAGVLYFPATWGISKVIPAAELHEAYRLLPFAFISFVLQNISNVVSSALIGFGKSYQKSIMMLFTLSVQGVIAITSVKYLGLVGVAIAQITQYLSLIVLGWVASTAIARGGLRISVPYRFSKAAAKDLLSFGARLQVMNIASFLFEPATKFALSAVLGLNVLGLYEVVSRGVLQVRQLVIAPTQNLTPVFTAELALEPHKIAESYNRVAIDNGLAAAVSMGAMALGSPIISWIWLRHIDGTFILFSYVVAFGWFWNIFSVPGYYLGIASAKLRWNILGGAVTTILSPIATFALGKMLGSVGAVSGAILGISSGAIVTALFNCRDHGIRYVPSWSSLGDRLISLVALSRLGRGAK